MKRLTRRRTLTTASATGLLLLPPRWAFAAPARDLVRQALPNGLTVLIEERRTADTVAVSLAARAGSRDDGDLLGVNLLTSRMMFQGTPRRPSETDVQRTAIQVGGTISRGTDNELSTFASVMPAAEVALAFDLISDLLLNPLLSEDALARQQQIALQEIAQSRADPPTVLSELFQAEMFAGHPVATPVRGTPETVRAITRASLEASRAARWGAANLVLVIVGRLAVVDALRLAEQSFGPLPAGTKNQRPAARPTPLTAPRSVFAEVGERQTQFRLGMAAPPITAADRYPLVILNTILGGASGRLFSELRTQRGLAYTAGSNYLGFSDVGTWYAGAGVDPENLETAVALTRDEITRARETPPDPEEVANKIGEIAGSQVLGGESNAARAGRAASQELLGIESVEEFVRRIRLVTPEDVQRVARTYLDLDRSLLAVVGPRPVIAPAAAPAAPATLATPAIPAQQAPPPAPPPAPQATAPVIVVPQGK